jgi:hypothetical protein
MVVLSNYVLITTLTPTQITKDARPGLVEGCGGGFTVHLLIEVWMGQ